MQSSSPNVPRIRVVHYCPWGDDLELAERFLERLPGYDLASRVSDPADPELMRMGKLDCDWHAENVRAFAHLEHPGVSFLPALVLGRAGLQTLLSAPIPTDEIWWLLTMGQHPQGWGSLAGRLCSAWKKRGLKIFFYAFDEASRCMPVFKDIAPSLDILVHDEEPMDPSGKALLNPSCLERHYSWVANVRPFEIPFNDNPEPKIVFLGSKMGLTPHRKRQVEHLQSVFGENFVAIHDHSLPVGERHSLTRYKVSVCPEGRKFSTPAMAASHTDRPFWSGCLGLVPVSEDSSSGGRLEELHREGLIVRYSHGDLASLEEACRVALEMEVGQRRRIYEHFNRSETVGTVIADMLASFYGRAD